MYKSLIVSSISLLILSACNSGTNTTRTGISLHSTVNPDVSISFVNESQSNKDKNQYNNDHFLKTGEAIKFVNGKKIATIESNTGNTIEKEFIVKIDEKEFTIFKDNNINSGYSKSSISSYSTHYGTVGNSRFGIMHDNPNNTDYVFYTGNEHITPINDMPLSGNAKYAGYAVAYRSTDGKTFMTYDNRTPYPVNFDIDFSNKTINGKIDKMYDYTDGKHTNNTSEIKNIELSATITGNTFNGTKNGVSTNGIFVGSQAVEMTGLFDDSNNKIHGAFGTRKQ